MPEVSEQQPWRDVEPDDGVLAVKPVGRQAAQVKARALSELGRQLLHLGTHGLAGVEQGGVWGCVHVPSNIPCRQKHAMYTGRQSGW